MANDETTPFWHGSEYKCAPIVAPADATTTLVAAPGAGKQIWVYAFDIHANTLDGVIKVNDSGPNDLSGDMSFTATGGMVKNSSGFSREPNYKCATNTAFQVTTTGCSAGGSLTYRVVEV